MGTVGALAPGLGCYLNCREEIHLTRGTPRGYDTMSRPRRPQTVFTHTANVDLKRPGDAAKSLVNGLPGCDTTRQVRNRRSPIAIWVLVDANQVLKFSHRFPRRAMKNITRPLPSGQRGNGSAWTARFSVIGRLPGHSGPHRIALHQRIFACGHGNEMYVVGHQRPPEEADTHAAPFPPTRFPPSA